MMPLHRRLFGGPHHPYRGDRSAPGVATMALVAGVLLLVGAVPLQAAPPAWQLDKRLSRSGEHSRDLRFVDRRLCRSEPVGVALTCMKVAGGGDPLRMHAAVAGSWRSCGLEHDDGALVQLYCNAIDLLLRRVHVSAGRAEPHLVVRHYGAWPQPPRMIWQGTRLLAFDLAAGQVSTYDTRRRRWQRRRTTGQRIKSLLVGRGEVFTVEAARDRDFLGAHGDWSADIGRGIRLFPPAWHGGKLIVLDSRGALHHIDLKTEQPVGQDLGRKPSRPCMAPVSHGGSLYVLCDNLERYDAALKTRLASAPVKKAMDGFAASGGAVILQRGPSITIAASALDKAEATLRPPAGHRFVGPLRVGPGGVLAISVAPKVGGVDAVQVWRRR